MVEYKVSNTLTSGLNRMASEMPAALSAALNRTNTRTRTELTRSVRERYNIKKKDFESNVVEQKATRNSLIAGMTIKGKVISLINFAAKWRRGQAVGASAEIIRGQRKTIPGAFIGSARNRQSGDVSSQQVFQRMGKSRLPIKKLVGVSAPSMVRSETIQQRVYKFIADTFPVEFERAYSHFVSKAQGPS